MREDPMLLRIRLLNEKKIPGKTFKSGSIQHAQPSQLGGLHIVGYPSVILRDEDWRPLWDRTDLIREEPKDMA